MGFICAHTKSLLSLPVAAKMSLEVWQNAEPEKSTAMGSKICFITIDFGVNWFTGWQSRGIQKNLP